MGQGECVGPGERANGVLGDIDRLNTSFDMFKL